MEQMSQKIKDWLYEAGEMILQHLDEQLQVEEKSSRKDLVTNMDRKVQAFLIAQIHQYAPDAKILAEEEGYDHLESFEGQVFIIDPIDGTLNFVMEGENFCIMLAVYEEGVGKLGFIYDVTRKELYWGGKNLGVFKNESKMKRPENKGLSDGLLGVNGYMYGHDKLNVRTIGDASMGIRVNGCAGLEMIAMLKGNHVGYLSSLSPWDYAAGCVLLTEFGMSFSSFSGNELAFSGRELFLAGTQKAYEDCLTKIDYDKN